MNKLYSNIEDLKKDLVGNGELLVDFSDEELKTSDSDSWVSCGSTSRGNKVLGMKITFPDTFGCTAQYDVMIRYIIVS